MTIEFKLYSVLNGLGNEEDACNELVSEYNHTLDSYISDLITEVADSYTPIYTNELWEGAKDISEYIEDALHEFGTHEKIELTTIFAQGFYYYYSQVLYQNFDEIKFNFVAELVNNYIKDNYDELDFEEVENEIESRIENIDNNCTPSELNEIAQELISEIEQGGFVEGE